MNRSNDGSRFSVEALACPDAEWLLYWSSLARSGCLPEVSKRRSVTLLNTLREALGKAKSIPEFHALMKDLEYLANPLKARPNCLAKLTDRGLAAYRAALTGTRLLMEELTIRDHARPAEMKIIDWLSQDSLANVVTATQTENPAVSGPLCKEITHYIAGGAIDAAIETTRCGILFIPDGGPELASGSGHVSLELVPVKEREDGRSIDVHPEQCLANWNEKFGEAIQNAFKAAVNELRCGPTADRYRVRWKFSLGKLGEADDVDILTGPSAGLSFTMGIGQLFARRLVAERGRP